MNQYVLYGLIVLAVFSAGAGFGWHEKALRVPALLTAQRTADNKQCNTDKQTTKVSNDKIISNLKGIADKYNTLVMQHPATCVSITSKPIMAASRPAKHAGQNGRSTKTSGNVASVSGSADAITTNVTGSSTDFRLYAAEAELYRATLLVCIANDAAIHAAANQQ